ncbi:GAG-pre-integrase domain [Fragilaria crotonensis]|nr:GAG-pre-integrase domain [Fragilaria crotonensis]
MFSRREACVGYDDCRSMDKEMQAKLWAEATKTAALLGNVLPNTRSTVPPDELFYGEKSKIYPHLIQFGRVGYVTNRATMKGKFKEKSSPMVMIGYGENHARDVYRMYNPVTSKVVETRDVHVWADVTNAANDIRLTLTQVFDPELILEEEEAPIEQEEKVASEEIHLIPEYEEELAVVQRPLSPPLSEAGRIHADATFNDDERPRIDGEIDERSDDDRDDQFRKTDEAAAIEDESDSDDSRSVQTDDSDERVEEEDLPELPQRENAPEMAENETNDKVDEIDQTERPQRSVTRLEKEMKRLGIDEPIRIEDDEVGVRTRSRTDQVAFNATLSSDPGEPKTFRKAMDGKNGVKWKPSAIVEINNFLSRDAWKKFPREMLKGRKPIPVKWIFKIKEEQDGSLRYKSRIVLKGYVMIPGVDYTEFFSPVATDTTVRTTIAVAVYRQGEGWIMEMIDIEAAFLNAELEADREVFAEWPEGMVELGFITEDERRKFCIKLTRPMYGGVDVPRLFMKTLFRYLTQVMKMIQSLVDPCLYYWKNTSGEVTLMAVVHVDDVLLAGKKETIEKFKLELKKRFNISDLGRLKKHLGVWYDWKTDDNGESYVVASMTKLEDEIVESFETSVGRSIKEAETPGYPNKFLSKNKGEPVRMTEYRSIVGKIMYLMTKLAPDLANPARELAQHLSNPGDEHWKALERLVGHIKARYYEGLTYRKPKELRPISFVDSDYAKNIDDRKSISSGLHTLGGTLVNWESKTQHVVTLSSTEAEYISLAKGACENKFIMMLLDEVMRYPKEEKLVGRVYEDNLGAIYLVKNQHVGARTKHIDVRAHFIRELEEAGYLKVQFVRSEENSADILNKNCPRNCTRSMQRESGMGILNVGGGCRG